MFKKTGIMPVLIITFMLTMAATAFAGTWGMQDNHTIYTDENGNRVYNAWVKSDTDKWHWLDSNGFMAVNQLVDENYYVNTNGEMVVDTWVKIPESDGNSYWFYFGSTGKMLKSVMKVIDGVKYSFDDYGHMQTGWAEDDKYFFDQNGKMVTGWQTLEDPESVSSDDSANDETVHKYYFQNSGKKVFAEDTDFIEKRIDGQKYCFDVYGRMQTGWVNLENDTMYSGIRGWRYYNSDGTLRTGWYSLNPPESLSGNYADEVVWFYFQRSGEPYCSIGEEYSLNDLVRINGKKYLFNRWGTPLTGLQKVGDTAYYFGTASQCCVQAGNIEITQSGSKEGFYFSASGGGYTGVRSDKLYYMGRPQKADATVKYEVVTVGGKDYVIGSTGKIIKKKTVKDGDGVKLTTNASGILMEIDEEPVSGLCGREPEAPEFDE